MLPPAFRPTPSKPAGTQPRSRRTEGLSPCLALQQTDRSRLPFHTGPVKRLVLPSCLNSFFGLLESMLRARRENLDNSGFSSDSAGPGCANPGMASRCGTAWEILFEEIQRWKRDGRGITLPLTRMNTMGLRGGHMSGYLITVLGARSPHQLAPARRCLPSTARPHSGCRYRCRKYRLRECCPGGTTFTTGRRSM